VKNSDWHPPENIYVDVEGRDIRVPEIDEFLQDAITGASESIDHHRDQLLIVQWIKALSEDAIKAGEQYFTDRWTWDTGHPFDHFLSNIFEIEATRRRTLMRNIDDVMRTPDMASRLKKIQAYHDARDKADGNT
jgi:hypothetical protein